MNEPQPNSQSDEQQVRSGQRDKPEWAIALAIFVFGSTFAVFYALWNHFLAFLNPDNGFTVIMRIGFLAATSLVTQMIICAALTNNSSFAKTLLGPKNIGLAIRTIYWLIFGSFGLLAVVTIIALLISSIGTGVSFFAKSLRDYTTRPNTSSHTPTQNIPISQPMEDPNHISNGDLDARVTSYDLTPADASFPQYVLGTVANNGSTAYSYVEVDFDCYDKSGNLIGNGLDNVRDLEPGKTWNFSVNLTSKTDHYKMVRVTGRK